MTRQRLLLIVLLTWALAMIVPDVLRIVQPLGSFGFYADNDGMIYEVVARSTSLRPGMQAYARATSSRSASFAAFPTTPPPAATR